MRVHGKSVESSFDIDGKETTNSECEFIWSQKGDKWRVDILEPDGTFPSGIWKTVMPFGPGNIISIRCYPVAAKFTNQNSSAFVTIYTNWFVSPENIYGSHVIWLAFKSDEVLSKLGPTGRSAPFWSYNPAIKDLNFPSHLVVKTNGLIQFLNLGNYYLTDASHKLLFESNQPQLAPYPAPFDAGFPEAELRVSENLLDTTHHIPANFSFTYYLPSEFGAPKGTFRLLRETKLLILCTNAEFGPLQDSVFNATWTNTYAKVLDYRERGPSNSVMVYSTTDGHLEPDSDSLKKRRELTDKVAAARRVSIGSQPPKRLIVLGGLALLFATAVAAVWVSLRKQRLIVNNKKD
ncbi:MAG TPA: hypothetical protein VFC07_15600 [Verrucomicrobiae bacterium]|nr:hypothetical protein [Verrucomicrobiae bacterium]